MNDNIAYFIKKYSRQGVVMDTNVLLLYAIGTYDVAQIEKFKRTQSFTSIDFGYLLEFLEQFDCLLTTPNLLTELTNLTEGFNEQTKHQFFKSLSQQIQLFSEQHFESSTLSKTPVFQKFGLADTTLSELGKQKHLILSDDLRLTHFLHTQKNDCLNFNHIRSNFNN
jgi:hypothetical protein